MSVASLFAIVALLASSPDDTMVRWPQFRGSAGGVAADDRPLVAEFAPTKNVVWKTSLPRGCSSPCIWGDRIFLTAFDAEANQLQTICITRDHGEIQWRRSVTAKSIEKVHEISSPATPTPATDGEAVYAYFGSFGLVAYDWHGRELWTHPLSIPRLPFGTGSSPIVVGERVILNVDQQGDSYLLAVDRRTGRTAWKRERASFQRGWSTPVQTRSDEIVVLGGQRLVAYDLADGSERWWLTGMPPFPITTPVMTGERLVVSVADEFGEGDNVVPQPAFDEFVKRHDQNGDGKLARSEIPADWLVVKRSASEGIGDVPLSGWYFGSVDQDKSGSLDRTEWDAFVAKTTKWPVEFNVLVMAVRLGGRGDVTKTHVDWRETRGVPEVPSPLVYGGRVYLVRNGGIMSCRDLSDGRLVYQERLGASGGYYASPVAGDGKVYAASDRGTVTVIRAGDQFEVLSRNDLGEPIMATPALGGGTVYIRTAQWLYAFGPTP